MQWKLQYKHLIFIFSLPLSTFYVHETWIDSRKERTNNNRRSRQKFILSCHDDHYSKRNRYAFMWFILLLFSNYCWVHSFSLFLLTLTNIATSNSLSIHGNETNNTVVVLVVYIILCSLFIARRRTLKRKEQEKTVRENEE